MDELGRGTSTFDGTAIASSTLKHLALRNRCLSLFATHYHSLLDEWKDNESVELGHMECVVGDSMSSDGADNTAITFLYSLGSGACPRSFGINVARLAGLPEEVLHNAKQISTEFELEMNGESARHRAFTARTALSLKLQITQALERQDWDTLSMLREKLSQS